MDPQTTPGRSAAKGVQDPFTDRDAARDLRARRRQWMEDDLGRIAIKLFLDRGYESVSVEEIAASAGISERTFFRYFATKEAVLRRYRQSLSARLLRIFTARPEEEPPLLALRNAYVDSAHLTSAERPRIHALERLMATTAVRAKDLGEAISDSAISAELARRMKVDHADLRPLVFAAAISAAAATGWASWADSAGDVDPSSLISDAIDLLGLHQ